MLKFKITWKVTCVGFFVLTWQYLDPWGYSERKFKCADFGGPILDFDRSRTAGC